ncbi:S41 family peptidase [Cellulosilyticum sp. I15G10I2]|uniref:S41 family peptidase n=1 Tax=Cellulosilyticum sp. I15G10I2 TaxID=1892843 RepID=UPI00085C505D|nr:S41 family peptidase [Cellulosilyticum sp. I15G10I2]
MKKNGFFRGAAIGFLLSIVVLITSTAFVDKYYYVDKKLLAIEAVINNYFVGDMDQAKMQEGIYKGFVAGVGDVYTNYYTPEEYQSFKEKSSGVYAGIGVQMTIDPSDNTILITEVFEGSPAQKAGIIAKDKIIKAGGKTITGDDFELVPKIVKGAPDTQINLTIYRSSEDKIYDFEITRQNVTYPSVVYRMLEDDLAYIKISQFEETTYDQFKKALTEIENKKAKGIVLDLRNNPGGLLHITEKIADELLPKVLIVSTRDKNGTVDEAYADENYTNIPIVVVVNGDSASASEVLSGALKDHNRAKLVGETTFGKGVVQSIVPLSDGSALKLTTAKYFTPSGICIQGIGIEPDYKVSLPIESMTRGRLEDQQDTQLQKAIEVIQKDIK